MIATEARSIRPATKTRLAVELPPSKSYTQRALIAAALAEGTSTIVNPSRSADSSTMIDALRSFGIGIADDGTSLSVTGCGGSPPAGDRTIDVGNAGTCMRFLTAFAALVPGTTILTGDRAMRGRPAIALVEALRRAGVDASCAGDHPPVTVRGGDFRGGAISLDASISSQFLSALLLVAPYAARPVEIRLTGRVSSAPYVGMTLEVMRRFGASCAAEGTAYAIGRPRGYGAAEYRVETDVSSAAFFGAAAAITRSTVTLRGVGSGTLQGDIGFFRLLGEMGCDVDLRAGEIIVTGAPLCGIRPDMNALPDSVPALAVTAAFASGPTTMTNIAHLRHKESDRLHALSTELGKIGASATAAAGALTVVPGPLHGADIDPYDDHRIAMSFAVAGLRLGGTRILNPGCVKKSFPGFWTELDKFS